MEASVRAVRVPEVQEGREGWEPVDLLEGGAVSAAVVLVTSLPRTEVIYFLSRFTRPVILR